MSTLSFYPLTDRCILRLNGADVKSFLQGMITNNIAKLSADHPLYTAVLTPQGKLLFDMFLYGEEDEVLLECEAARAEELIAHLNKYKLRADVKIERIDSLQAAVVWGENLPEELPRDPRHKHAGARLVCTPHLLEQLAIGLQAEWATAEQYHAHRIALGLPHGSEDFVPNKTFAAEIGLEALHGVDFTKGCYVGQEVTARTKHKGTVRKGLCVVRSKDQLPAAGSAVFAGDIEVGQMHSSAGNIGLAMLRFEHAGAVLQSGEIMLDAALPAWAPQEI